jgi:alanine racemase
VTATPIDARAMSALLTVDLAAIRENYRLLARRAGVPLIAMVKADAYGLGAVEVAKALDAEAPMAFGVANVAEGVVLRAAGITRQILVFTPTLPHDFANARAADLTLALSSPNAIAEWTRVGGRWHLAVDTGMNRAGAVWRDHDAIRAALGAGAAPDGVFTHFTAADADAALTAEQEARFVGVLTGLAERPQLVHAENSAALLRRGPSRYDCARPGIALYGAADVDGRSELRAVVSLAGTIVELREVESGDTVSYGATWRATSLRRIATVALGYADGYPRGAGNSATALVNQRQVPVVGVVTMDMTMCDVTGVPCTIGDRVTLIGSDAGCNVTEIARHAGRSPYEILTGLRARAARVHMGMATHASHGAAA